jgi:chromosome segregation ATPase
MTRPRRTRAIAAMLLAILVALGGVGCGGGGSSDRLSKSQYETKVKSIGSDLQTSLNTFNSNNKDLGQLETKVGQAQTKLQSAASQLKSLKPPSDAEADTKKLAAGLTGLANQFNSLKQALASGDLAKVQQTANAFKGSPAAADAKAATEDLKKKGYDVGVFGT